MKLTTDEREYIKAHAEEVGIPYRTLLPNVHSPELSWADGYGRYGNGQRVRWVSVWKSSLTTAACSEYSPENQWSRASWKKAIMKINRERESVFSFLGIEEQDYE